MPDASHDFGAHLRQAREQRGISLRDIAERTKISMLALEALERNDVSRLPGGIFTRAFVRAYACEVGLDAEDTVRRFLARFPDQSFEEAPRVSESNRGHIEVDEPAVLGRGLRALAWSLPLLVGVAYFGFGGRLPFWPGRLAAPVASPVEQIRPPVPPPPAAPDGTAVQPGDAAVPAESSPAAGTVTGGAAQSATPPAGAQQVSPATSVAEPAAGAVSAASQTPTSSLPEAAGPPATREGAFRVTLAPREACWVSVRANGTSIYSGLMRPGERRELALEGDVTLMVGNAGAFDFFINDQPGRSLGGPGQVVTARLSANNLKTFVESR